MSLTSKLKGKSPSDIKLQLILKEIIPDKNMFYTLSGKVAFSSGTYEAKVPYALKNKTNSIIVGIAFDYLARFLIAQKIDIWKGKAYSSLVAKEGLSYLVRKKIIDEKLFMQLEKRYDDGISLVEKFIFKEDNISIEDIIPAACFFARLEFIYRNGYITDNIRDYLLMYEEQEVIFDLNNLSTVFVDNFILSGLVRSDSDVVFNPHFGFAARYIGGVDADIFIDGVLYDFKTSKVLSYEWKEVAQVIGYYLIDCIAKEDDDIFASLDGKKIYRVAFYRARYGEIEYFNIDDFDKIREKQAVNALKEYLQEQAKKPELREK